MGFTEVLAAAAAAWRRPVAAAAILPSTSRRSSSCWSGPTSPYIADEAPNVDIGQSLGKQARPERFDADTSCFNEGIDLILRDRHLVVVQDEGGVDASELGDGSHAVDCRHGASRRMK